MSKKEFPFAYPLYVHPTTKIYVLRFPQLAIDSHRFDQALQILLTQSTYQYSAKDASAPQRVNCVTAIRYLFANSSSLFLPPVWLGDLPRVLLWTGAKIERISLSELQKGDLLFFRGSTSSLSDPNKRFITHIAVALDAHHFFHASFTRQKKGHIERVCFPEDLYAKRLIQRIFTEPAQLVRYVDPRYLSMRQRFGEYLPDFLPPYLHLENKKDETYNKGQK